MNGWLEVARHELVVAVKTRRVMIIATVYIAAAVTASLIFAFVLRQIELAALHVLNDVESNGPSPAAGFTVNGKDGFLPVVEFFAGLPSDKLSPLVLRSATVPLYFWSTLTFMPFLAALSSFDVIQSSLQNRTLCFSSLRVSRRAILLGKYAAHATLHGVIAGLAALVFVVNTVVWVDSVHLSETLPGIVWTWFLSLPVFAAYLGLTFCASTLTVRAINALMLAVGGTMVMRFITWLGALPEDSRWSWLRGLRWISPVQAQSKFWHAGWLEPLIAIAAYLATAVILLTLADRRLQARDL